jgi:hypothetical protein
VFLHFLDDLLLQDLSLEPAEGILYRLALLKSNLCQIYKPPTSAAILRLDQSPVFFNCHIILHADDPTHTNFLSALPIAQGAESITIAMTADRWQTKENAEFLQQLGFYHGLIRLNSGNAVSHWSASLLGRRTRLSYAVPILPIIY